MREVVHSDRAPRAVGPYSQAIRAGGLVWLSGQIGLDPVGGTLVPGGVEAQARQVLENLRQVAQAAGSGLDRVVRTTIYLTDMADFETVNRVYAEVFSETPPARACVAVQALPKGASVEIDAIAVS